MSLQFIIFINNEIVTPLLADYLCLSSVRVLVACIFAFCFSHIHFVCWRVVDFCICVFIASKSSFSQGASFAFIFYIGHIFLVIVTPFCCKSKAPRIGMVDGDRSNTQNRRIATERFSTVEYNQSWILDKSDWFYEGSERSVAIFNRDLSRSPICCMRLN